jgi:hypothetical protein
MREAILRLFLHQKVGLSAPEAGAKFLESLTPDEIEEFIKDVQVPWYNPQSDDIFKLLAKSSKLESLEILIPWETDNYIEFMRRGSIIRCNGFRTIMNVRECRKISFAVGYALDDSVDHRPPRTDDINLMDLLRIVERTLTVLCSRPRRRAM